MGKRGEQDFSDIIKARQSFMRLSEEQSLPPLVSGKPLSVLRVPSVWPTPAEVAIVAVLWLACIACAVAAARIDMSPPVATRAERAR